MSNIEYHTRVSAPLDTGADYFVLRYDLDILVKLMQWNMY